MIELLTSRKAALAEQVWFYEQAKRPKRRTVAEFAAAEVMVPDGPEKDAPYSTRHQPAHGIFFSLMDSGRFNRTAATGCTQSGKTMACSTIPTMYHLFEFGETAVYGLPDLDMARDKWEIDIKPVIEKTQYKELLPRKGAGSRGGMVSKIDFLNGASLRFMAATQGTKGMSAFTARAVVMTEVDGMDTASATSREGSPVQLLEGRARAFGDDKRIYLECTVSIDSGCIWKEYQGGTETRLLLPCGACGGWVAPEREHLVGWQNAATEDEARENARVKCPACGALWDDRARRAAVRRVDYAHRGQEVIRVEDARELAGRPARVLGDGWYVAGPEPATRTLGFRWNAIHNMFASIGATAAEEWRALHISDDPEESDKNLMQQVWARPYKPPVDRLSGLDYKDVIRRGSGYEQGRIESETECLAAFMDLGKWRCKWAAVAFREDWTATVVDYGEMKVMELEQNVELEDALGICMAEWVDMLDMGWKFGTTSRRPDIAMLDAGAWTKLVYRFARGYKGPTRLFPSMGFGHSVEMQGRGNYSHPDSLGRQNVRAMGDRWHMRRTEDFSDVYRVNFDADYWKSRVFGAFTRPVDEVGAATLYQVDSVNLHIPFAKELAAEAYTEEWDGKRGQRFFKWRKRHRDNHYLDAVVGCFVGAAVSGLGAPAREEMRGADVDQLTAAAQQATVSWDDWFGQKKRRR